MHELTKTSGVAVSALAAATATVLLVLPGNPQLRADVRGTSAAVQVLPSGTPAGPSRVTPSPARGGNP